MKAIAQDRYGPPDALEVREVEQPSVGDDDVLVRVQAASANPYDLHFMRGMPYIVRGFASRAGFGLRGPRLAIRGRDLAGQVEAVGGNVRQLRPGDEVYGVGIGTFAGFACASERELALKPRNLTFVQAAAMPIAATTALRAMRDLGRVGPGHRVLVNGAAGGVGTFAVQIARSLGADTTGVCSTRNVEMVRSVGADHVIDYTGEDFTRGLGRYDLILDLVGNHAVSDCRRALAPEGTLLLSFGGRSDLFGPIGQMLQATVLSRFASQTLRAFTAQVTREDLVALTALAESGRLTPVIDRTYPLDEGREAMTYLEAGHARGKVVLTT
ncbi:MAG TPA: NAD(P)-dependent alcohol dehydrogenase [Candidatus Limnocylindrales bacterium]|nr:NAD(P)-dependent alcohol dehydrogenase [Candidatus Limnocylindrales bacterium]